MSKSTPEELKQLRDGATQSALQGGNVDGLSALYDLVSGQEPGPEPQD